MTKHALITRHVDYSELPAYMQGGMMRYMQLGIPPGDFLSAVLANQFLEAFIHADEDNTRHMKLYAAFLYNEAPYGSYGSVENFRSWIARGGMNGSQETA